MDYTAIGDTINLASRMEGLAQPGTVLLSRDTQRLVKDYFDLNPIGPLEVKGKEEPRKPLIWSRPEERPPGWKRLWPEG
jgi:class 3 adenylate cyclase